MMQDAAAKISLSSLVASWEVKRGTGAGVPASRTWRAGGTAVGRPRTQQVSAFLPDMFLITGCKASIRWGWSDLQIAERERDRERGETGRGRGRGREVSCRFSAIVVLHLTLS